MKRHRIAQALTVAVLLISLGVVLVKKAGYRLPAFSRQSSEAQEPQDAVYAMLAAAREGNVRTYLASFTGPMEKSLRQTLAESTATGFAKYLRDSNAAIKGVAVSDPGKVNDLETKVRVEYVYQDRNEAQILYLAKTPAGWKISRSDGDERVKTLIPYGTPIK